jgi:hypothetical protein
MRHLLLALAPLALGFTLPACPGQAELQQEVISLRKENEAFRQKAAAVDRTLTEINGKLVEDRTLLKRVSETVLEQKAALERMDASLKALASRPAPAAKAPARAPAKPAVRKRKKGR